MDKADILSKIAKIGVKQVWVEALGDHIFIRPISAGMFVSLNDKIQKGNIKGGDVELMAGLITGGWCDEAGKRIFSDDDVDTVMGMPIDIIKEVGEHIMSIVYKKAEEQEAEKNE